MPAAEPLTLRDFGEDRLVAALTRSLPRGAGVRAGVGDDCAVLGEPRDARWTLLKTDAVVEGIHFTTSAPLGRVGWKALCRAISDFAAMGGAPEYALITLAAPAAMPYSRLRDFYTGLRRAARAFAVAIVGGETSSSPGPLFCSVSLVGSVEAENCIFRSGGRVGDALYVTGRLGGSLKSGRHLSFTPRLAEARWLVAHFKPHAMMDLSDGLASDLPRLAEASHCGSDLWISQVPRSPGCTYDDALQDGEDFELLFAIDASRAPALEKAWRQKFPRLRLTRVGSLTPPGKGPAHATTAHGFDHFA